MPHISFYRESDKTGKRLWERDLYRIPGRVQCYHDSELELCRTLKGATSEVFPAEIDDQERVCAFDNPKLFHVLLLQDWL